MEAAVKKAITKGAVKVTAFYIIVGVVLILGSGSLNWWGAWLLLALLIANYVIDLVILDPELLKERSSVKEGARKYDIVLAILMSNVGTLIVVLVAAMDKRFDWSVVVPWWLQLLGLVLILLGCVIVTWAMSSNKYFAPLLRIQKDRGHLVATTGPYRFVRHPGYFGAILTFLGIPIILGTLWAFVPVFLIVVDVIVRTALEDGVLQDELIGYSEYTAKVKYRLIPGVW